MNEHMKKLRNNKGLIVILIIGLVLLVAPSLFSSGTEEKTEGDDYRIQLEVRLEDTLSQIKGAGAVRVMVTLCDDGEVYPAVDTSTSQSSTQEKNVVISGEVAALYKTKPKVQGVVVVAEGGGNPTVKESLSEAVRALCDVSVHNIKVFSLK